MHKQKTRERGVEKEREKRERRERERERLKTTEDESDCIRQKTKRASSSSHTVCPPDFDKMQKEYFELFKQMIVHTRDSVRIRNRVKSLFVGRIIRLNYHKFYNVK